MTKKIKEQVKLRAHFRCEYCQVLEDFSSDSFEIEHIFPICKGGLSSLNNLALACRGCNGFKGIRTEWADSNDGKLVPLFNPRTDIWTEHFQWETNQIALIGLTPTGRVTIDALKMNRRGLLNLRTALILMEEHPPFGTI